MSAPLLFKVLVDGKSCHGGSMTWSLPKDGQPGEWHEVEGPMRLCSKGLHLTDSPAHWWKPGCIAWVVEAEGVEGDCAEDDSRKVVARRVRLVRQATEAELSERGVFLSGQHSADKGDVIASGSASVRAYGSASVSAYGSASVRAYGSASVRAYDSASVRAYDSASVSAYDSASVSAEDSASVSAYDSASVSAYDSASVSAEDSASVSAEDDVTVVTWRGSPAVKVIGRAIHIDRTGGAPRVMTEQGEAKVPKRKATKRAAGGAA